MYVGTVKKSLHFTNQNNFSNLITSLQFLLGTRHQIMIGIIIHTDTLIDQINQGKKHELLLILNNTAYLFGYRLQLKTNYGC